MKNRKSWKSIFSKNNFIIICLLSNKQLMSKTCFCTCFFNFWDTCLRHLKWNILYTYIENQAQLYRVSNNYEYNVHVERTKLSQKVLYHFAIFTIINEKIIAKKCRMRHTQAYVKYKWRDMIPQWSWLLGVGGVVFYKR